MERLLHTVMLPDGLPLDISEQIDGLKIIRVAGGKLTPPEAADLLIRTGHQDVVQRFQIPRY